MHDIIELDSVRTEARWRYAVCHRALGSGHWWWRSDDRQQAALA
jgi:hypothetical protein